MCRAGCGRVSLGGKDKEGLMICVDCLSNVRSLIGRRWHLRRRSLLSHPPSFIISDSGCFHQAFHRFKMFEVLRLHKVEDTLKHWTRFCK